MRFVGLAFSAVVLAAILMLGGARAETPLASVPYRTDLGQWLTVSATINGRGPYEFIIDSGTSHTLIFESAARETGAAPAPGQQQVFTIGASGVYPCRAIGDIAVGDAKIENVVGAVLADWPVGGRVPAGILGLDFLEKHVVVFDAVRREVAFYAPDAAPRQSLWARVPMTRRIFKDKVALYTIAGVLDRRPVELLFDIGAAGTVVNDEALEVILRRKKRSFLDETPHIQAWIVGAQGDAKRVKALKLDLLTAGDMQWRDRVITIYNAPMFAALGRERSPFGLFGADLLAGRSFAMDFSRGELRVGPPSGLTAATSRPGKSAEASS